MEDKKVCIICPVCGPCKGFSLYTFVPASRILHKIFAECLCNLPIAIGARI